MTETFNAQKVQARQPLELAGTFNTRELGGYPAFSGNTQLRRCLRSDSLDRVTPTDIAFLQNYPVCRVIDLRSSEEAEQSPEVRNWSVPIEYFHVSLDDKMSAKGYKGKLPETLAQLYQQILVENKKEIAQVLSLVASAPKGAVLFNCAVGKDRTGVIAMLLLKICGVPDEVIVEDYKVSARNIVPIAKRQTEVLKRQGIEIPAYVFESNPEEMQKTLVFLQEEYGGIAGYLEQLDLSSAVVWKIVNRLCGA